MMWVQLAAAPKRGGDGMGNFGNCATCGRVTPIGELNAEEVCVECVKNPPGAEPKEPADDDESADVGTAAPDSSAVPQA